MKIENCKLQNDDDAFPHFDAPRFRRALTAWYRRNARPLPWRNTNDPYRIWISEIMLQQTTVVAVVPYFERFLERFPTLAVLAAAKEEEVLRLWEGLGYYSRARNIHKTARHVVGELGGVFPDDVGGLCELPGIGRYTAGAIASFAFQRAAPILEANTLRLYSRLLGFRGDPRTAAGQKLLWDFAARIVPRQDPGPFNQALMELGATLCSADQPGCPSCPVRTCCAAFAGGAQHEIPVRPIRAAPTEITEVAVAVQRGSKYLLLKRPAGERWAGLWDFVRFAWTAEGNISAARLASAVRSQTGLSVAIGDAVTQIRHSVTRFRITLHCYKAEWAAGDLSDASREFRWVAPGRFSQFPLSVTGRRLARLLVTSRGKTKRLTEKLGTEK
ncbi:MAG TPA: A/G-specific adenine glycosylase [Planctomycetaceae bacterium]